MMNKSLMTCLVLGLSGTAWAQKPLTLKGKVPASLNGQKVFFNKGQGYNAARIDSALISNGTFEIRHDLQDTISASITFIVKKETGFASGSRTLFLAPGQQVTITVPEKNNGNNLFSDATVKGAPITNQYDALQKHLLPATTALDSMRALNSAMMMKMHAGKEKNQLPDTTGLWARSQAFDKYMKLEKSLKESYIEQHPQEYISLYTLREMMGRRVMDVAGMQARLNKLSPALQRSSLGLEAAGILKASDKLSIHKPAPDFSAETPDGKTIKLSDLRGKYVLLDFWASWCGPCRAENPHVVKAYQRFKDKNFDILGVSLDRPGEKDKWTAAIEKDQLTWHHVSDLKWWKSDIAKLYMISSIPQNFLLDPQGNIIALNLRGEALEKELEKVLQ